MTWTQDTGPLMLDMPCQKVAQLVRWSACQACHLVTITLLVHLGESLLTLTDGHVACGPHSHEISHK